MPGVDSDPDVFLVMMTGTFVKQNAYVPPGVPAPRGTVVTFTVERRTHLILDFTIGNRVHNLTGLGTVRSLGLPGR